MIPLNNLIKIQPDESGSKTDRDTKPESGIVLDANNSKQITKGQRVYFKGYLMDIINGVGAIREEDLLFKDEPST